MTKKFSEFDRVNQWDLPEIVDPGRIKVCFEIPYERYHIRAFWTALYKLTLWNSWAADDSHTGRESAAVWRQVLNDAMADPNTIGCGDEINCATFAPDAPFIEWFPNNPYTEPDLITDGYNAPAWYRATPASNLLLGTQTGDIVTDLSRFPPGSLPTIIPASGLPRFRINLQSSAVVTIHLLNIFGGSVAQITIDDDIGTIRFIDMDRDQIAIPFETATTTPVEVEVLGEGEHHIDVIVVSQLNDQIPFLHHGGGLRKVEICGEAVEMPYYELRQSPEDNCLIEQRQSSTGEWFEAFRMDNCCSDDSPSFQRYNEDSILETSDDGITWEERRDIDPRFNSPVFPPLPGADGEDKKCAAAASVVETIKIDIVEKMEAGQASNELLAIILAAIALFLSGGAAAPLVMVMIFEVINFGIAATQAAFTAGVWDQFKCIVYCNISDDGSFTEEQWKEVWRQSFAAFNDSIVQTLLGNTIKAFGPVGLTNAARSGRVIEAECTECDCPDCPCDLYMWNWSPAYGTPASQDFTRHPANCAYTATPWFNSGDNRYYWGIVAEEGSCLMISGLNGGGVNVFHGYIPSTYEGSYSWFNTSVGWASGTINIQRQAKAIIMVSTVPFDPYSLMFQ